MANENEFNPLEAVGVSIATTENVYEVASYSSEPNFERCVIGDDFNFYRRGGYEVYNSKFYRKVTTIIENTVEITEEEWKREQKEAVQVAPKPFDNENEEERLAKAWAQSAVWTPEDNLTPF